MNPDIIAMLRSVLLDFPNERLAMIELYNRMLAEKELRSGAETIGILYGLRDLHEMGEVFYNRVVTSSRSMFGDYPSPAFWSYTLLNRCLTLYVSENARYRKRPGCPVTIRIAQGPELPVPIASCSNGVVSGLVAYIIRLRAAEWAEKHQ